jgi:hypothetical protein
LSKQQGKIVGVAMRATVVPVRSGFFVLEALAPLFRENKDPRQCAEWHWEKLKEEVAQTRADET